MLKNSVLVVGAGGLGCEILKCLVLGNQSYNDIHVVDMDTVEMSNLSRQFLFTKSDIGRNKAIAACERLKGHYNVTANLTPHDCTIESLGPSFISHFDAVVCGLDSVSARRYVNAAAHEQANIKNKSIIVIDGGCEGFAGQTRIFKHNRAPSKSSCFDCHLDLLQEDSTDQAPNALQNPFCSIPSVPRTLQHCVLWAALTGWPYATQPNLSEPQARMELLQIAKEKAKKHNFDDKLITISFVVATIGSAVPSVSTTNAIVASTCCIQLAKALRNNKNEESYDNYFSYSGYDGVYSNAFSLEKNEECLVCGTPFFEIELPQNTLLRNMIVLISRALNVDPQKISLRTESKTLYMKSPKQMELQTRKNLDETIETLLPDLAVAKKEIVLATTTDARCLQRGAKILISTQG